MTRPSFLEHLHPPRMPAERIRFTSTFCLGGVAFLLFIILGISGGVLMFSYVPTPQGAARFFAQEAGDLPFAWFFRGVHYLAGQAMVAAVLLHLIRVLAAGAYLPPRGLNWLVGLGLLCFTLFLDLSGYILRWDGPTQAAATVVGGLMAKLPGGSIFRGLLFAGPELSGDSLLRFYVLHCLGLPILALLLTMFHFWRIRRDGKPTSGL